MTPDEEIDAAYKRLLELRKKSPSAQWATTFEPSEAELAVALRRTVDAQIYLLGAARAIFFGSFATPTDEQVRQCALVLARAINEEAL